MDRWLWGESLWEKEGFKTTVENVMRNVNVASPAYSISNTLFSIWSIKFCVEIFKIRSFLQSKSVNNVYKLLQLLGNELQTPTRASPMDPLPPKNENPLTGRCQNEENRCLHLSVFLLYCWYVCLIVLQWS